MTIAFRTNKISYNEHMKRKTDTTRGKIMELRVLKYFLMAALEENITRTSKASSYYTADTVKTADAS